MVKSGKSHLRASGIKGPLIWMHCSLAVSLSLSLSVSVTTYITVNKTIYNYIIITIYIWFQKIFILTCIICGDSSLATNHALGQPTLNSIIYFTALYIVCMNDTGQSGPKVDECIYRYLVISTDLQRFSGNDHKAMHAIVGFRVSSIDIGPDYTCDTMFGAT